MAKFLGLIIVLLMVAVGVSYNYYTQTGYTFGLEDTIIFSRTVGVSTPDFEPGGRIPADFTCEGINISPTLNISRVPEDAQSLAVIMEDVSNKSKTFTHWIVFNIDPNTKSLDSESLFGNATWGINDFGNSEYNGPCPEDNKEHKYFIRVYALNSEIQTSVLNRISFDKIISGHVISSGMIAGVYSKSSNEQKSF